MPITQFWDMHSGGGTKEAPYEKIYIEAPLEEAMIIFYNRFGHNPERVSCTCCGSDYSIQEYPNLHQATGFHRGCDYDNKLREWVEKPKYNGEKVESLKKYLEREDVLFIKKSTIKKEERTGTLPRQGYIWCD